MTTRSCPDGGACHHDCGSTSCWRVTTCEPLSGVFPGDTWPKAVQDAHAAPAATIESIIVGRPDADGPRPVTVAFVCPIETCRATREISADDWVRGNDPVCKGAEPKEHRATTMVHRPATRMTTPDLRHRT
jgi:hypothetical protein